MDEKSFLKHLFPRLTTDDNIVVPPGDDCAALVYDYNNLILYGIDQIIEGTHFPNLTPSNSHQAKLIGRKLLTRNLSDIAAMAGTPKYSLVSLAVPDEVFGEWTNQFTEGLLETAKQYNVHIIGGDISKGNSIMASLTIIGMVPKDQICLRKNAQEDDYIFTTGTFGGSFESGRHFSFYPRLEEAKWLANNNFTKCIIDVSDGLLLDLLRICESSHLSAVLDEDKIPRTTLKRDKKIINKPVDIKNSLLDGEDYELLFSVPPSKAAHLQQDWPFGMTPLNKIGKFIKPAQSKPSIQTSQGKNLGSLVNKAYIHFK